MKNNNWIARKDLESRSSGLRKALALVVAQRFPQFLKDEKFKLVYSGGLLCTRIIE